MHFKAPFYWVCCFAVWQLKASAKLNTSHLEQNWLHDLCCPWHPWILHNYINLFLFGFGWSVCLYTIYAKSDLCHNIICVPLSVFQPFPPLNIHTHENALPPFPSICSTGRCVWPWCSVRRVRGICVWGWLYLSLVPCLAWELWWQRRATSLQTRYIHTHTQKEQSLLSAKY